MAANTAGLGVTLLIQLVSVPVFLSAWGVPTYGEWLVLSAIPTYLTLSDLSLSSVAGNKMVMLMAQGSQVEAVTLGRRLWSIVMITTGVAVAAAVAIGYIFGGAFGVGAAIPAPEARTVLVALFLQVAVINQYGGMDAWYRAGGRYPLGASLRQLGRLFEFSALMGAVLLGARPGVAAIAFLAGSMAGFVVSLVVLRRAVPWSVIRPERPHLQTFRELFAPGVAFMAFPVGNALSLQGTTIVVGAVLGSTAVVVFSTTRTLTRVLLHPTWALGNSIWPEQSRLVGAGRLDAARVVLCRATQLSMAASLSLAAVLAIIGANVIRWWTRGAVDPPRDVLYLLLTVVVCNSFWYILSTALVATNRHKRLAAAYLLSATAAVLAAVPLTEALGLTGTALALLAIEIAMIGVVLRSSREISGDSPAALLRLVMDVPSTLRSALAHIRSTT